MTPTLYRWVAAALLALALVAAGLKYRDHLIDTGHAAGVLEMRNQAEEARRLAKKADDLATAESARRHATNLKNLKDTHDRIARDLRQALADSGLRAAALSADLARLHDEAAGLREGLAAAAAAPGGTPGTPEPPAPQFSVADLIETTNENYATCRRNASRLEELQQWYRSLRAPPPE